VVILEALDKPELPERLRAVELLGHESTNQPAQLCLATRRAERGLADVVFEVKVRIIHPDRATEVERHAANRLAIARNPIKLAGNHVQQRPIARCGPFEDADGADMHVADTIFDVEERRVRRAQSIERHDFPL